MEGEDEFSKLTINNLYRKMIDEIQDYAIILIDSNGIIRNWNAGAEKIKLFKEKEIVGKHFSIFYFPEDLERNLPQTLINLATTTGRAAQEGWRRRKDGTRFWGSITITAIHDEDNRVIGFSKVTRDLTELKLSDEKLALYTRELEIQNSELEQFAYVASHDLQEPLRKIQTFSELIQKNYHDEEFVKKYFEKLNLSAKRMSELVRSLLNYSRLSKDKSHEESVDLNQVALGAMIDFELLIEERNAQVLFDELPVVRGSRSQLGQLFSNLISNSLKFSDGSAIVKISARAILRDQINGAPESAIDNEYWEISFVDNGIGFEQQYDKIIFSLFQRLHGKNDYAGTGIGLALCKKIAENHNGFILAVGELKKGATFKVYLPTAIQTDVGEIKPSV